MINISLQMLQIYFNETKAFFLLLQLIQSWSLAVYLLEFNYTNNSLIHNIKSTWGNFKSSSWQKSAGYRDFLIINKLKQFIVLSSL